jgi:hypothetical protein
MVRGQIPDALSTIAREDLSAKEAMSRPKTYSASWDASCRSTTTGAE